jgi:hypothetical protein
LFVAKFALQIFAAFSQPRFSYLLLFDENRLLVVSSSALLSVARRYGGFSCDKLDFSRT